MIVLTPGKLLVLVMKIVKNVLIAPTEHLVSIICIIFSAIAVVFNPKMVSEVFPKVMEF